MGDNHACCDEAQVFRDGFISGLQYAVKIAKAHVEKHDDISVRCIAHITEEIQTAATDNASNSNVAHEAGAGG